jgi:predicted DNA-binding transcriptional regulator AlpA
MVHPMDNYEGDTGFVTFINAKIEEAESEKAKAAAALAAAKEWLARIERAGNVAALCRIYLRYKDLKARGIFNSRMTLMRRINAGDFPPGRLITPNCRVWSEQEVAEYAESRPVTRKRGRPKKKPEDGVPAQQTGGAPCHHP